VKTRIRLRTDLIHTDGGTQPRAASDQHTVTEYAEAMQEGAQFPPVVVFNDGKDFWLADGFHRVLAARVADILEIDVDLRPGTKREAILYAVGANAEHGMRRTNEDKRRAVFHLLGDAEWAKWSDNEIARRCAVSQPFVSELRQRLTSNVISEDSPPTERTYTTKHGTEATMDTERIGRSEPRKEAPRQSASERFNESAEAVGPDAVAADTIAEVDKLLVAIKSDTFRHSVINALIKHLREKSIELNRKAGAA
jgi:hypothetical protein